MCPHQLLKKLCHEGMGSLRAYYEREAAKGIRLGDAMNFHIVVGSRLRRLEGMLDSSGTQFAHKVIEVVCEGGRALSTYSKMLRKEHCTTGYLCCVTFHVPRLQWLFACWNTSAVWPAAACWPSVIRGMVSEMSWGGGCDATCRLVFGSFRSQETRPLHEVALLIGPPW